METFARRPEGTTFHGYTPVANEDSSEEDEDGNNEDGCTNSSDFAEDEVHSRLGGLTLEWCAQDRLTMDCRIEKNCLYGAAIAMPQLARSAGWHPILTTICVRVYMMLCINYFLSGFLAYSLIAEQNVMDPFTSQPNLCDFGANVAECPGRGCMGPGGTQFAEDRLFDWKSWKSRMYVKSSLMALFPQMKDDIEAGVDAGEYGVESYWCRLVCAFIFVTAILDDLYAILRSIRLLIFVPTEAASWIEVKCEEDGKAPIPNLHDLHLHADGIPLLWKAVILATVIIPRWVLWSLVCRGGIMLLMESSDVTDQIVNTVALNFILDINMFLFRAYELRATKHFLNGIVDFAPHDPTADLRTQSDLLGWKMSKCDALMMAAKLFPGRLTVALAITSWYISDYYQRYCQRSDDGTWVSKAVREPVAFKSVLQALTPRIFQSLLGLPDQEMLESKVMWSMGAPFQ